MISHFDDLLQAAQHAQFEAGEGGALVPLMCVDKRPEELALFAALRAETDGQHSMQFCLVHSRFGLHVIAALQREAGRDQPFEAVQGAIAQTLRQQTYVTALRQYLALLAGQAELEGVEQGQLALHGWHYVIEEGEVHVFDVKSSQFVPASSATHSGTGPYAPADDTLAGPLFNEIDDSYAPKRSTAKDTAP